MKTLLTFLFLLFSSSLVAEDISDFQIEGFSIGDSLLDYFSKKEIYSSKENISFRSKKFYAIGICKNCQIDNYSLDVYDALQIYLKLNDEKYIIHSIVGGIYFDNNINNCLKQRNLIIDELKTFFTGATLDFEGKYDHQEDKSGKSTVHSKRYKLASEGYVTIACYDWSKKMQPYRDHLRVQLNSNEIWNWIINEAY